MSGNDPQYSVNPFLMSGVQQPIVAILGKRKGYLMVAPAHDVQTYANLPDEVLLAAKAWALTLEQSGASRVYWIILSEVTRHLHIHVFPRWPEDSLTGVALFESRDSDLQPAWSASINHALKEWARTHDVHISS